MLPTSDIAVRELDHRHASGLDVRLLWSPRRESRVLVVVDDERSGDAFVLEVAAADALDAFRHPYAYAGRPEAHELAA